MLKRRKKVQKLSHDLRTLRIFCGSHLPQGLRIIDVRRLYSQSTSPDPTRRKKNGGWKNEGLKITIKNPFGWWLVKDSSGFYKNLKH